MRNSGLVERYDPFETREDRRMIIGLLMRNESRVKKRSDGWWLTPDP